jgi:hypothetical protein
VFESPLNRAKKKVIDSHVDKLAQLPPIRPFDDDAFGPSLNLLDPVQDRKAAKRRRTERRELLESWWKELDCIESEADMLDHGEVQELRRLAKGTQ